MTARPSLTAALALLGGLLLCSHAAGAGPSPGHSLRHLHDLSEAGGSKLLLPTDVTSVDGKIFVVDSGNSRIVSYNRDGKYLSQFGRKGSGAGEFDRPVGIGSDGKGHLYVADSGNHRVQVFDDTGRFLRQFETTNPVNGAAVRPIDVATIPGSDTLYVTGNTSHSLLLFKQDGSPLTSWGQEGAEAGEFRYPATLIGLPGRRIAVIDVLNSRLQLFNRKGTYLTSIGEWGVLPGQLFRPKGVAVDARGLLYISDSYMNVVQVFDDTGSLHHVLQLNDGDHVLKTPAGMTVDANQRLYVAELLNNRVSVYDLGQ